MVLSGGMCCCLFPTGMIPCVCGVLDGARRGDDIECLTARAFDLNEVKTGSCEQFIAMPASNVMWHLLLPPVLPLEVSV